MYNNNEEWTHNLLLTECLMRDLEHLASDVIQLQQDVQSNDMVKHIKSKLNLHSIKLNGYVTASN